MNICMNCMNIAWLSGLSDQNLVTNPQCYKDRQNRSSLLSISMIQTHIKEDQWDHGPGPLMKRRPLTRGQLVKIFKEFLISQYPPPVAYFFLLIFISLPSCNPRSTKQNLWKFWFRMDSHQTWLLACLILNTILFSLQYLEHFLVFLGRLAKRVDFTPIVVSWF